MTSSFSAQGDADFVGGAIYTCDLAKPWAEAMAVRDGRIVAIGDPNLVDSIGGGVPRIDLQGSMAMPGIIDGHNHVLEGARAQLYELTLDAGFSFAQILDRVAATAAEPGRSAWIIGGPFLADRCPEMESGEGRAMLDRASRGRPVLLRDLPLHSRFVNSAALAAAGITRDTPDPPHGVIVRDAHGEPTGLLHESGCDAVESVIPMETPAEWRECGLRSMALLNSVGVTGFGLAIASGTTLTALKALDEAGELTAWAAGFMIMEPLLMAQARDLVGDPLVARRAEFRSKHLSTDFAKFFMDGVPLMRTASFLEPYRTPGQHAPGFSGHSSHEVDDLAARIGQLDRQGISVKIHTIGDKATRDTLDAIEIARSRNPAKGPRHSIAHMVYITAADIPRLKQLDVIADLNPPMWYPNPNMAALREVVGDQRVERSWSVRDIVGSGTLVATGTDWPALAPTPNPWPGMAALITRAHPTGAFPGTHRPDQALDLRATLPLYTINAAESLGLKDVTGSLEVGKSADLIVLDRNLFEIPSVEIARTQVKATYFEGKLVYEQ